MLLLVGLHDIIFSRDFFEFIELKFSPVVLAFFTILFSVELIDFFSSQLI